MADERKPRGRPPKRRAKIENEDEDEHDSSDLSSVPSPSSRTGSPSYPIHRRKVKQQRPQPSPSQPEHQARRNNGSSESSARGRHSTAVDCVSVRYPVLRRVSEPTRLGLKPKIRMVYGIVGRNVENEGGVYHPIHHHPNHVFQ